jgi:hypothetical protein
VSGPLSANHPEQEIVMRTVPACSLVVAALLPLGAVAADSVTIPKRVPFAKGADIPQAVVAECGLPEKTAQFIQEFAGKNMDVKLAENVTSKTPGKVLTMQLTGIKGTAGGAWSGAKAVSAEGTLYDNGKVVGSFKVIRHSGGGAFGGYKGTCSILGRCSKAVGKDVAGWLQAPSMNARLGEMK